MPIYAYKCNSCGLAKDVLRKLSDEPLSDCPSCGAATFQKQLTAAGFQLKGSGWYATDFRGGKATAADSGEGDSTAKSEDAGAGKSDASADANGNTGATTSASAKAGEKKSDASVGAKAPEKAANSAAAKPAASVTSVASAGGDAGS